MLDVEKTIQEIDLLFVPDGGSNDAKECKKLIAKGINVIILDHHIIETENPYAILINPYRDKEKLNTDISGTGVVQKFCSAYYSRYRNCEWGEVYNGYDIVGISLISDICDLTSLENRTMLYFGFEDTQNEFLDYLFTNKCKRRGKTTEAIGWDIAPLSNALARSDNQDGKLLFYNALIGDLAPEVAVKKINAIKRETDGLVKKALAEIEPTLDLSKKVLVSFTKSEYKSFIGLVAMNIMKKYNKPSIVLRELNSTTWTGSFRCDTMNLYSLINETNFATAQGHEHAGGVLVSKANYHKFIDWLESLDIDDQPEIPVTAMVKAEDINLNLVEQIKNNNDIYGNGVPSPTFYLKCNNRNSKVFVFENRTNTIKIQIGDLSCLKFFVKEEEVTTFKNLENYDIELIVGKCDSNEYNGIITPQCQILNYEIHEKIKTKDENWEDTF